MIFVLLALFLLNGLFVLSEMAIISTRKARLQRFIDNNDSGAIAALKLMDNIGEFLSAIQIGIVAVTLAIGAVGESIFAEPLALWLEKRHIDPSWAHWISISASYTIVIYFNIVLGELVPKRLAQLNPEKVSRIIARPFVLFSQIAHPFIIFLSASTRIILRLIGVKNTDAPHLTEEEIQALLAESSETGIIDEQEHQMVRNVFRLDLRSIGSLMVPRADVVWLSTNDPLSEQLKTIESCRYSRFPVCGDTINDVIGIITAKKLLNQAIKSSSGEVALASLVTSPLYVPESLNGMELLNAFRTAKCDMALVVDEYGDIQGIVTIQDLIEAITGQFDTSNPSEALAIARNDGSWLLDGLLSTPELKDYLDIKALPEEEKNAYNTLSGMIMLLLGRMPKTLDAVEWSNWRFEIVDMDGMRIDKVLASNIENADDQTQK